MNLKEIRENEELTQAEVAKILNVSCSTYGMWESEHDIIPLNKLIIFGEHFNVSADYLLGKVDSPKYF